MPSRIKINEQFIFLDFREQEDKHGRAFRLSGVSKDLTVPSKWIGKSERWNLIYSFLYVNDPHKGFKIFTGYNDEFLKAISSARFS